MPFDGLIALMLAPVIGSFLGVVIDRLPTSRPVVFSRSVCDDCGCQLGCVELVPLVSFIVQGGCCRHCGKKLRPFYPLIELAALAVVLSSMSVLSGWLFWLSIGLGWCLLILAVIDHRHMVLPDGLTLPLIPMGLFVAYLIRPESLEEHVIGAVLGFVSFATIGWTYRQWRGRDGLGLGDAKLLAASGAWLGWTAIPGIVLMASVSALLLALLSTSAGGRVTGGSKVALGSHLALAFWISWLAGTLTVA